MIEAIAVRPIRRNRRSLDELLTGITDDSLHAEVDSGPAVGRELIPPYGDPELRRQS